MGSKAPIEIINEILVIERTDVIFIGPKDLAASMGKPSTPDYEKVRRAISSATSKTKSARKFAAIFASNEGLKSLCMEADIDFIGIEVDKLLLQMDS